MSQHPITVSGQRRFRPLSVWDFVRFHLPTLIRSASRYFDRHFRHLPQRLVTQITLSSLVPIAFLLAWDSVGGEWRSLLWIRMAVVLAGSWLLIMAGSWILKSFVTHALGQRRTYHRCVGLVRLITGLSLWLTLAGFWIPVVGVSFIGASIIAWSTLLVIGLRHGLQISRRQIFNMVAIPSSVGVGVFAVVFVVGNLILERSPTPENLQVATASRARLIDRIDRGTVSVKPASPHQPSVNSPDKITDPKAQMAH